MPGSTDGIGSYQIVPSFATAVDIRDIISGVIGATKLPTFDRRRCSLVKDYNANVTDTYSAQLARVELYCSACPASLNDRCAMADRGIHVSFSQVRAAAGVHQNRPCGMQFASGLVDCIPPSVSCRPKLMESGGRLAASLEPGRREAPRWRRGQGGRCVLSLLVKISAKP